MMIQSLKPQFAQKAFCLFISILLINSLGCFGQNKDQMSSSKGDTTPEPFHQYGPYKLKFQGSSYLFEDRSEPARINVSESYPGILVVTRLSSELNKRPLNTIAIEYYDPGSKILKRKISLEEITPYTNLNYENIIDGTLDPEELNVITGIDSAKFTNISPNSYRTINRVWVSPYGFTCISFCLLKLLDHSQVIGWEQTFIVLDLYGNEIHRNNLNHDMGQPYISMDGQYLAFGYGNRNTENPFEPSTATLDIYDLKENKHVIHFEGEKNEKMYGPVLKNDKLFSSFSDQRILPSTRTITIVDFPLRKMDIYKINLTELNKNHNDSIELDKNKPYQTIEF